LRGAIQLVWVFSSADSAESTRIMEAYPVPNLEWHDRMVRRASPWVLTLWVSFLALAFLQPCCEAIAATVPHGHDAESHSGGQAPDQPGDPDAGRSGFEHNHCAQSVESLNPLPIALTDWTPKAPDPELAALVLVLFELYGLPPGTDGRSRAERVRAPPAPIFLSTLRLRI